MKKQSHDVVEGAASADDQPVAVVASPSPEKEMFSWRSPARVYKKRDREYFTTVAVIVLLLSVILLFAKEFLLIGVILSLAFVSYALASVPPPVVEHRVTNKGVRTGDKLYRWDVLGRFWFEKKWNQEVLVVESLVGFPAQLNLLLAGGVNKKEVAAYLSSHLIKERPQQSFVEKSAKWLQKKVPLETGN